jgi:hypothetical protein
MVGAVTSVLTNTELEMMMTTVFLIDVTAWRMATAT